MQSIVSPHNHAKGRGKETSQGTVFCPYVGRWRSGPGLKLRKGKVVWIITFMRAYAAPGIRSTPYTLYVCVLLCFVFLFNIHGPCFICIWSHFKIKHTHAYNLENTQTLGIRMALKRGLTGFPWWHSGWESACQCRGHGFKPWSGKIPHAAEQLGLWATIAEPARLEPVLHNKRGRDNERPTHRDEEWPPLATTRESPRTETKTQHSHK